MRSILTIIAVVLSISVFAGNDQGNKTDNEKVIEDVCNIICADDVVNELGINGQADISFTVDAQGVVHIQAVQSNDFLLEYHIRKTLEGMKVSVTESIVGKTFTFIMNIVQPD